MNKIEDLAKRGLISPPKWLPQNVQYLTIMGSVAYGVSDGGSDFDVYGWCIPPKDEIFPHLRGEIDGFGKQKKRFWQYQQHHINAEYELGGKGREYDITVYNIVKYFQLVMENNPNMIDSLFTPRRCVLTSTPISEMVRENRKMFLHRGCWHKFRGYAYSQLHKIDSKNPTGKRKDIIDQFGYDVKFGYHTVRLVLECRQILQEHNLDLERNRELLKSIRRGEWALERLKDWFEKQEKQLETLYHDSILPYRPDENKIKELLLNCLEHHYGDLSSVIIVPGRYKQALLDIQSSVNQILSVT